MSLIGLGGFGGQFDPDLGHKIDEVLKNAPSLADRNDEFLKSLGIDPEKMRLSEEDALEKAAEIMVARGDGWVLINFDGSSVGLNEIRVVEAMGCPNCKSQNLDYDEYEDSNGEWQEIQDRTQAYCEPCNQLVTAEPIKSTLIGRKDQHWLKWNQVWEALKGRYTNKFVVAPHYPRPTATAVDAEPLPELTKVVEGQDLRVVDGQGNDYYVKVWRSNPLDDSMPELFNLRTMQPMTPTSDWQVVEII